MNTKTIVPIVLVSIFLASCASVPNIMPVTPTPTSCPYVRNPGPPPPEVQKRAQNAFLAMGPLGIRGTLKVEANGEYSCDHFAVENVNFEYTLYVSDLKDQRTLQDFAAKVTQSAKESLQGWNMGDVRVRFVAGEDCWWDAVQKACAPIRPLTNP